jgi:hypothetical protein
MARGPFLRSLAEAVRPRVLPLRSKRTCSACPACARFSARAAPAPRAAAHDMRSNSPRRPAGGHPAGPGEANLAQAARAHLVCGRPMRPAWRAGMPDKARDKARQRMHSPCAAPSGAQACPTNSASFVISVARCALNSGMPDTAQDGPRAGHDAPRGGPGAGPARHAWCAATPRAAQRHARSAPPAARRARVRGK